MTENYMVINGERYPVINAWVEVESPSDGRKRWGIVTEPGEEVQPAAPAGATVSNCMQRGDVHEPHEWRLNERAYWCQGQRAEDCLGQRLTALPGRPVREGQEPRYVERPSGPPVRVDGPGCTPFTAYVVPNEEGEALPAGSLYADKCAECTTGATCEAAGHCTFEG